MSDFLNGKSRRRKKNPLRQVQVITNEQWTQLAVTQVVTTIIGLQNLLHHLLQTLHRELMEANQVMVQMEMMKPPLPNLVLTTIVPIPDTPVIMAIIRKRVRLKKLVVDLVILEPMD